MYPLPFLPFALLFRKEGECLSWELYSSETFFHYLLLLILCMQLHKQSTTVDVEKGNNAS